MTCALQMMKPSLPMQDWKAIFPDFTTLTGSCQFIKKLMAVSLSAITYIRGVFPEKAYGERHLCGIKLKLLTEDSGLEGVDKFINLIRSCYDAVDKKYLYQLNIGICTDAEDRDSVVESYNMNFRFRDDEFLIGNKSSAVKLTESDPTVEATFWLLKNILSVSDILSPLPQNAFLTMKLLYHDQITPQDYEPPGFEPSDTVKFRFSENAVKLELGKVSTDIHGYKMYLKTTLSKKPLSQILEESVLTDSQKSKDNILPTDYEPLHEAHEPTEEIIQSSQNNVENKGCETDCPCTCKQDTGTNVLTCSSCGKKQHAICYGLLELADMNSQFLCTHCIGEAPFRNSQAEDLIYRYEGKEQQELCAFRRALVACKPLKQVTLYQLEKQLKCSKQLAKDLTERLVSEGFIQKTGLRNKYKVDEEKIIDGYKKYFFRSENKENAENSQKSRFSADRTTNTMDDCTDDVNRNSGSMRNGKLFSEHNLMEYEIDKEVEKLNLKGLYKNRPVRNLRRSLQAMVQNESDELHTPKKKRCMTTKEVISLH